jgi:hypothetical protein
VLRRPDAAQRWRLVVAIASCASAKAAAGTQTLAAMVFRSEAQDKAKSTEFNAETSTRCCAGSGALELACFALVSFSR